MHRRRPTAAAVLIGLALAAPATAKPPAAAPAPPLPLATPESQGMSSERLGRLHAEIERFVNDGKHAGVVSLLARNGRIVDWRAWGMRDIEAGLPMEKDTICRIYSMSKIVTSVAALILLEEARFRLDDPVGDYLPELARIKVLTGGTAEKPLLADAKRPITIKHLFTHTSGLTYDGDQSPVEKLNREARLPEATSLPDFIRRVSPSKLARLATTYEKGEDGKLRPAKSIFGVEPGPGPKLEAGGAGLFSTPGDYARFLQMLLSGGELEGVRILSRKTVELMMANHLNHMPRVTHQWSESDGFGLGGAVRIDLAKGNALGSVGQFGWSGAATTYANLDPKEKTVALLFVQHFPHDEHEIFWRFSTLFYRAIVD